MHALTRWTLPLLAPVLAGIIAADRFARRNRPRPRIRITTPMPPPAWALLERELLRAHERACVEFFDRYFDDRGYLECVERWGGDDGPDDAIENVNDWPVLYALGAPTSILTRFKKAWEGHLRQYTEARTTEVPFARDGMYLQGIPRHVRLVPPRRGPVGLQPRGALRSPGLAVPAAGPRFAGFYMDEDPGAPNYDPKHKIIRSLFNGSRGPLLRKATASTGPATRSRSRAASGLGHGERSYDEMLEHFKDYNDIVGDHPLNLGATTPGAQRLHADPRGALQDVGPRLRRRLAPADARQRRDHPHQHRPRRHDRRRVRRQVVRRRLRLGIHRHRPGHTTARHIAIDITSGSTASATRFCSPATTATSMPGASRSTRSTPTRRSTSGRTLYPHMYGDQGWYDYRPEPYGTARWSSTTGR